MLIRLSEYFSETVRLNYFYNQNNTRNKSYKSIRQKTVNLSAENSGILIA